MRLDRMLALSARRLPDKVALYHRDEALTYAALEARVDALAGGLAGIGLKAGDRVALFMPNCPWMLESYLACFRAGLVAVPLNHRYVAAEVEFAVDDCRPLALLVHAEMLGIINVSKLQGLGVRHFYAVEGGAGGWSPVETLTSGGTTPPAVDVDDGDPALVFYTSGSTSRPKGVTHTHGSFSHAVSSQVETQAIVEDDVNLASTSIAHTVGLATLLDSICVGATAVLIEAGDAQQTIEAIEQHSVTRLRMLPVHLEELLEHPAFATANLRSLRMCMAGGDRIPLELQQRFRDATGVEVAELLGMTECPNFCVNPPGRIRPGSVGLPSAGVTLRLIDEEGAEALEGEILIQSAAVMQGYWNNPQATADVLQGGWLHTGDLARRDADGYYWFLGRKKEIIVRGGSNIAPGEVEVALGAHPAVELVGVVGQADPHFGHVPIAFVVLNPGVANPPDEAELIAFVASRLAAYKVPVRIVFRPSLPLNGTGKVDRRRLAAEGV